MTNSPKLPVDDSVQPEESLIGCRVRELRLQRNLSLRALAGKSGLNVNTLSLIENNKTSPSVSTLQLLARALGVPLVAFFDHQKTVRQVVYTTANERPSATVSNTLLENLGKDLAGGAVQPFLVTLAPGTGSGEREISHSGHEFVFCLEGQVCYQVNGVDYQLKSGDSLVFQSHLPHSWINSTEIPALLILVIIPTGQPEAHAGRHFMHLE